MTLSQSGELPGEGARLMREKALKDPVYRLYIAQEKFDRLCQTLFWYDSLPPDDELRDYVWQANRLYHEIRSLEYQMSTTNDNATTSR
jgi:hypothetical protein